MLSNLLKITQLKSCQDDDAFCQLVSSDTRAGVHSMPEVYSMSCTMQSARDRKDPCSWAYWECFIKLEG